jgi:hypothetical protein
VIGIANAVLWIAGWKVSGESIPVAAGLGFPVVMLAAAVAMWKLVYWAVLAFEALLAITILYAGLALLVAENVVAALLCLAILVPASLLFWFLIRPMARMRLPERPRGEAGR